jgi:hypothetical protein
LGTKHNTTVCPFSPWRFQRTIFAGKTPSKPSEEESEGVVAGAEDAGDVFPDGDDGRFSFFTVPPVNGVGEHDVGERQVPASIVERTAQPRDGKSGTWRPADEHVARWRVFDELQEVAVKGHVWEAMREHGARERFDLREADGLPAKRLPCDGRGLNT